MREISEKIMKYLHIVSFVYTHQSSANFFFLIKNIKLSIVSDVKQVVFVILSQENKYHAEQAEGILNDILQQSGKLYKVKVIFY